LRKIRVEYTGKYPNACSGALLIYADGELVYSTERNTFRPIDGKLKWRYPKNRKKYLRWANSQEESEEIKKRVRGELSGANVCCGGCD
jgi:hypothetical protein